MATEATTIGLWRRRCYGLRIRWPRKQEIHRHGSDEPEDEPTNKHEPTATAFGDKVVSHLPLEWMHE